MQSMKSWLNKYFGFTKREYNALLALFGLLALAIVTPFAYELFFLKEEVITEFEKNAILQLSLVEKEEKRHSYFKKRAFPKGELFAFDPNSLSLQEWKKLGLSAKQAQSILNYRNKGGRFYKAEDLKKMYAISPQMFERLEPYVDIKKTEQQANHKRSFEAKPYAKKEFEVIEINTADTLKLDEIKGIGAAFARRIATYRNRLGGFYKKEQLMEVFGLDSIKFQEIKAQIKIDPSAIKKININTADFEALKNHPYLKYKQINAIIQYRKQHGMYSGIADLKKVLILSPQTIELITPYLQF